MANKRIMTPASISAKLPEIPWHWYNWDHRVKLWGSKPSSDQNMEVYGNAMFWWWHADRLDKAARTLWEAKFPETAVMLGGMALETLFKSLILARAPRSRWRATFERITSGRLATHDLTLLLRETGMRSNKADRRNLETLSHYVRWAGRYPTPRQVKHLEHFTDIIGIVPTKTWNGYLKVHDKFFPRLRVPLNRLMGSMFKAMKLPQKLTPRT